VKSVMESVASKLGLKAAELAESILENTSKKVEKIIKSLIREYKLDKDFVILYGGGGGASAIVPHAARFMGMKHDIAHNAEVISAIGAAMGMIRDTVEKSIFNPTENDIIKIRQQASESVISMGARPETVEVQVEMDNANETVIAIATGSSDLAARDGMAEQDEKSLHEIVRQALKAKNGNIKTFGKTNLLSVVGFSKTINHFFGLMKETVQPVVIMSKDGTIRRKFNNVSLRNCQIGQVKQHISELIEELRSYGDGGELMPDVYVVVSGKIVDMSGLMQLSQILSLVDFDLKDLDQQENAIVLAVKKR
jgi:N-methylhydantoinase A